MGSSICFRNGSLSWRIIIVYHGMLREITPIKIAAHPCTTPVHRMESLFIQFSQDSSNFFFCHLFLLLFNCLIIFYIHYTYSILLFKNNSFTLDTPIITIYKHSKKSCRIKRNPFTMDTPIRLAPLVLKLASCYK